MRYLYLYIAVILFFSCHNKEEDSIIIPLPAPINSEGELHYKDQTYLLDKGFQWYYGALSDAKEMYRIDFKLSHPTEKISVDILFFTSTPILSAGTYTYGKWENAKDMTFVYGDINLYGIYLYRIIDGMVEISIEENNVYTFKMSGRCNEGNLFLINYKGEIKWEDSTFVN